MCSTGTTEFEIGWEFVGQIKTTTYRHGDRERRRLKARFAGAKEPTLWSHLNVQTLKIERTKRWMVKVAFL
jgi:hypothetical protein